MPAPVPTSTAAPAPAPVRPAAAARPGGRLRSLLRAGALLGIVGVLAGSLVMPASAASAALLDCPGETVPSGTTTINGYQLHADAQGRPDSALAPAGTLVEQPGGRDSACTARVGHYADRDGLTGYDGGHLIADRFNGPSVRENLVPMQGTSVNRVVFLAFETAVVRCLRQWGAPATTYRVSAHYPNNSTLVPDQVRAQMTVTASGQPHDVDMTYPNKALSKAERDALNKDLDTQAAAAGCPKK
ncbi:DNA/RNA non-specific endonuclease [Kitasatospora sp. NPDC096077]|uniref:DNA/RNA non-specific endonuclease n=1 Tax=Kitasatospora sp. NPDC096077 TaxID=3155544 RepID=UPI0033254CA2